MKRFMKRLVSFILSLTLLSSMAFAFGCGTGNPAGSANKPDYSDETGEFMTYAYVPPTDGKWMYDGVQHDDGVDHRTKENYVIYKEAGLNTLLQQCASFGGGNFEESETKRVMDISYEAGITRTIVWDTRIWALSQRTDAIVGEGADFATFDDLVAKMDEYMSDYKDHPAFFGVMLFDEPKWNALPAYCLVYKACEEAARRGGYDVFVQANLYPINTDTERFVDTSLPENNGITRDEAYRKYITYFVENSGAKRIGMDAYGLTETTKNGVVSYGVHAWHMRGLQILAEVAAEYGCKVTGVGLSTALEPVGEKSGTYYHAPNKSEMYWQINAFLGFGFDSLGYYTYWRHNNNGSASNHTPGTSFVDQQGTPTDLYYAIQQIHGELQKMAPTILNFDYKGVNYYYTKPMSFATKYVDNLEKNDFAIVENVTVPVDDMALVTELYDDEKDQYMYMLMNPQAPANARLGDVILDATVEFDGKYTDAVVWLNGTPTDKKIENGKLTFKLAAGYAVYIMPYIAG